MNVLLTFSGFNDPYARGLVAGEQHPGPVLTLAQDADFDFKKIFLFSTPNIEERSNGTKAAIESLAHSPEVIIKNCPLNDPISYFEILHWLRRHWRDICDECPQANYFISVTSGTPQMHASWLLLAASGEIPAHVLNVRPQDFVTAERPRISRMDLNSSALPIVRANLCAIDKAEDIPLNIDAVIGQQGIIGNHPKLREAIERAAIYARYEKPILILGETGTGKELFARLLHQLAGNDSFANFISVNCGAIPKELVESQLFGHKRGSFTGAHRDQKGKFEEADKGTLFLDEIGDMPLAAQQKLLRVLQEGVVEPIGGKPKKVSVRVMAATNLNLEQAVKENRFRRDLFYRFAGTITLPALRERKTDIPLIALSILDQVNKSSKRRKSITQNALAHLQNCAWPGNVRELQHVINNAALLARNDVIDVEQLEFLSSESETPAYALPDPEVGFSLEAYLTEIREQLYLRALQKTSGRQSDAARLLSVSPQAIHKFLQKRAEIEPS